MNQSKKRIEFKFERTIPAPPDEVYEAWLNPRIPGNPWNAAEKFMLDPKVDGLFYWALKGTSHYGRFTEIERPGRIQHTWVSPNTLGEESTVMVTFQKQGEDTLMTLVHSDLPDHELARGHEKGWNYFLGIFREQFGNGSRKKYRWDDAHTPVRK
ncbi:MAG TPA: SRPBCC domain-containing protein [Candidatus Acidoferrales bacterium]|nr:SRPBCC domain-containing protein [Candidatus Acidoferrales bacterium]